MAYFEQIVRDLYQKRSRLKKKNEKKGKNLEHYKIRYSFKYFLKFDQNLRNFDKTKIFHSKPGGEEGLRFYQNNQDFSQNVRDLDKNIVNFAQNTQDFDQNVRYFD